MVDKHIIMLYNNNCKGGKAKMRKAFTSSIEETIQKDFKEKCNQSGIPQNVILEAFMKAFSNDEIEMKLVKNVFSVEIK